jgi:hypothetical protein
MVIRGLPVSDYHLKIGTTKRFHLMQDPSREIPDEGLSALEFKAKDAYFTAGEKQPLSSANPNRKLVATIDIIDKGDVEIIADDPFYLHVRFSGKKLKGLYYLRKTKSKTASFWTMKKGMASFSAQEEI